MKAVTKRMPSNMATFIGGGIGRSTNIKNISEEAGLLLSIIPPKHGSFVHLFILHDSLVVQ